MPKTVFKRRIVVGLIYVLLLVGGLAVGRAIQMQFQGDTPLGIIGIIFILFLFTLLTAIPFIPGIELGIVLLVLSGGALAPWVYAGLVASLSLAFLAGHLISGKILGDVFQALGLKKSQQLVQKLVPLPREDRLDLLFATLPGKFAPVLLRHRYATLVLILNTPGNTVIGGGGGIALVAGMSGLFSVPGYFGAILIAALPIPVLFQIFY